MSDTPNTNTGESKKTKKVKDPVAEANKQQADYNKQLKLFSPRAIEASLIFQALMQKYNTFCLKVAGFDNDAALEELKSEIRNSEAFNTKIAKKAAATPTGSLSEDQLKAELSKAVAAEWRKRMKSNWSQLDPQTQVGLSHAVNDLVDTVARIRDGLPDEQKDIVIGGRHLVFFVENGETLIKYVKAEDAHKYRPAKSFEFSLFSSVLERFKKALPMADRNPAKSSVKIMQDVQATILEPWNKVLVKLAPLPSTDPDMIPSSHDALWTAMFKPSGKASKSKEYTLGEIDELKFRVPFEGMTETLQKLSSLAEGLKYWNDSIPGESEAMLARVGKLQRNPELLLDLLVDSDGNMKELPQKIIMLPSYQRQLAWSVAKIASFGRNIVETSRRSNASAILAKLPSVIDDAGAEHEVYLLIDGQQRTYAEMVLLDGDIPFLNSSHIVVGEIDGVDVVTKSMQSLRTLKDADRAKVLQILTDYQISVNVVTADFEVPSYTVTELLESADKRAKMVEDISAIEAHTSEEFRLANMEQVPLKPAEIAISLMGEFVPFLLEPLLEMPEAQKVLDIHKLGQKATSKKRVKVGDVMETMIKTATSRSEGSAAIAQAMFLAYCLGIEEMASRPSVSNNFIANGVPELSKMTREELESLRDSAEEAFRFFGMLPDKIWYLNRGDTAKTSIPNFRILLGWFTAFFKAKQITAEEFWNAHADFAEAATPEEVHALVLSDFVSQFESLSDQIVSRLGKADASGAATAMEDRYVDAIAEGTGNLGVSAAAMAGVDAHFRTSMEKVLRAAASE